jgi:hypothetical protein
MLERFKRDSDDGTVTRDQGAVATAERPDGTVADRPVRRSGNGAATAAALETARARQRDEFGGVNWGASFFGWLVAVGVAALLTSLLVAAGAAIGLTESDVTTSDAEELSLAGGIALLVVVMLAYYAGGYVAGRMSRFDGARQGFGAWLLGLIVTIVLTVLAVIAGSEYNVVERANLPRIPIGDEEFASGGAIATALILVATLVAAVVGGKFGERYHRRVDRAGFTD